MSRRTFWDPSRLSWVNGLGFALTCGYTGWLILVVLRSVMPDADPIRFTIPTPYIAVTVLTLLAMIFFCGLVMNRAWRGGDFRESSARHHVLFWSLAGLAFFLVALLVQFKFGSEPLPNVAGWAATMFWRGAFVGLPAFALMAYVNSATSQRE